MSWSPQTMVRTSEAIEQHRKATTTASWKAEWHTKEQIKKEICRAFVLHLPIGFASDSVQILSALLAEIFIGTGFLVHDAHTTTMLPHLTGVALDEHAPKVIW